MGLNRSRGRALRQPARTRVWRDGASCLEMRGCQQPQPIQEHPHDRRGNEPVAPAHVRSYQLHLAASGAGVPTLNQSVSTLRFFFRVTLGRADIVNHTQFVREPRKLPVVLSPEEVARFLDAAPGLEYNA